MSYNSPLITSPGIQFTAQPLYVGFWGHHSAGTTHRAPLDRKADLQLSEECRTLAGRSRHLVLEQSTQSTTGRK